MAVTRPYSCLKSRSLVRYFSHLVSFIFGVMREWPITALLSEDTGQRSAVQVTRNRFALDPCSCWRSSLGTAIQGKTFVITLHYWTQSRFRHKSWKPKLSYLDFSNFFVSFICKFPSSIRKNEQTLLCGAGMTLWFYSASGQRRPWPYFAVCICPGNTLSVRIGPCDYIVIAKIFSLC